MGFHEERWMENYSGTCSLFDTFLFITPPEKLWLGLWLLGLWLTLIANSNPSPNHNFSGG